MWLTTHKIPYGSTCPKILSPSNSLSLSLIFSPTLNFSLLLSPLFLSFSLQEWDITCFPLLTRKGQIGRDAFLKRSEHASEERLSWHRRLRLNFLALLHSTTHNPNRHFQLGSVQFALGRGPFMFPFVQFLYSKFRSWCRLVWDVREKKIFPVSDSWGGNPSLKEGYPSISVENFFFFLSPGKENGREAKENFTLTEWGNNLAIIERCEQKKENYSWEMREEPRVGVLWCKKKEVLLKNFSLRFIYCENHFFFHSVSISLAIELFL